MADPDTDLETSADELPPSKSSRKRAAHAAQKLGEQLVRMRAQEVAQLPLSEELRDAIAEARRLSSRGALARQHQYIGKLMRDIDLAALEAALAAQEVAQNTRARLRK
jgi:ribosome-associated protein